MIREGLLSAQARAQYAAMFRMRWRMFVNGLHSIHGVLDLGATGIAWALYAVFGVGMGTGLAAAGYAMAQQQAWQRAPILFWAASILWLMFPIIAASYQDQSNLEMLLRFPLRLGSYCTLYLISGLMDASTIVGSLCCGGIWLGIFLARPQMGGPLAVVLIIFAAFNILLVRAVFAWIERSLAQRKSREILGAVFLLLVLGAELFNPALDHHGREYAAASPQQHREHAREVPARYMPVLKTVSEVQQWLAPGSAARAVQQAAQGRFAAATAWLSLAGLWSLLAFAALALRLRSEYRGQNLSWAPARTQRALPEREWTLGGGGTATAIVEKELRCLRRTMPYLFAIGAPLLLVLVIAGLFHPGAEGLAPPFAIPLCVAYATLGFTGLFYNNLGTEGPGIQLFLLSPTPIRTVILAKNLLHGLLFVVVGCAAVALGCLRLGIPSASLLAAVAAWLIFALPCNWIAGNILSLTMPYRVNPGRIGRPPGSQANTFTATLIQAGILGIGAAVFFFCRSLHKPWWAVAILLILAAAGYFTWQRVLSNLGPIAFERRAELIESLTKGA